MTAVKILGREYVLRGETDERHLASVVTYLEHVLVDVQRSTPDTQDAAILASLNVVSELLRSRESFLQPEARRLQALIDLVDSA